MTWVRWASSLGADIQLGVPSAAEILLGRKPLDLIRVMPAEGSLMIRVKLNGKPKVLDDCLTVQDLIQKLKINQNHFAIAVNYDVVPQQEFPKIKLGDGDEIDIILPSAGG